MIIVFSWYWFDFYVSICVTCILSCILSSFGFFSFHNIKTITSTQENSLQLFAETDPIGRKIIWKDHWSQKIPLKNVDRLTTVWTKWVNLNFLWVVYICSTIWTSVQFNMQDNLLFIHSCYLTVYDKIK